jgi:hypothetical protein
MFWLILLFLVLVFYFSPFIALYKHFIHLFWPSPFFYSHQPCSTFSCGLKFILFTTLRVEVSPLVVLNSKNIREAFNLSFSLIDENHTKDKNLNIEFHVSAPDCCNKKMCSSKDNIE